MHIFHKWGKWRAVDPVFKKEWTKVVQVRQCAKCGKIQRKSM